MIPLEKLEALPLTHRTTIPADYLDEMGHMNVQYYMRVFDRAAWGLFHHLNITWDQLQADGAGMFALRQFIQYLAEVRAGETVAVRTRVLGLSAKRLHFIHLMVNETQGVLAATLEAMGSYADLTVRRTAPFPPRLAARIHAELEAHAALDWDPPLCGVLHV